MAHHSREPSRPGAKADIRTIKTLLPFLWPRESLELRARVVIALVLLAGAKIANVTVPLFYKDAVDALSGAGSAVQMGGGAANGTAGNPSISQVPGCF